MARFANVKEAREIYKHVFKTNSSIRHYIFHSKENGLDSAISRLGRKVVIDLDKLEAWIRKGYQ